ncbi:MAG: hypothetical protein D6798_02845 [Deltaproteobacteria bacterium]|nr:MAG: hypothetical protein D6798_02845 [Deltaproteobacteria bacterium]
MARAEARVEVAAPPPVVMAVLTDFPAWPSFLPWVRSAEVLRRERGDDEDIWEVRLDLLLVRPLTFVLRLVRRGDHRLSWTLVEGPFRVNDGAWTLHPRAGGQRTELVYEIEVQPAAYVPGSVLESLRLRELPAMLQRVGDQALARLSVAATDLPTDSR